MYWKIVKLLNIKSWSLVNKLALLYSITTIAIVNLAFIILFPALEKINHIADPVYTDNLFSHCIQRLITSLIISTICAIIFGNFIARKSMNYVRTFSEKMKNLSVNSLSEKINTDEWPNELKSLAESYNVMLDKLQQSFNQLTQFSANIAHELRNPIHTLLGMNELALTQAYSTEKQREIFESNMDECRHLLKLIDSLLFLARADHGQTTINKIEFNARDEILKILDYYEAHANESNIETRCEGDAVIHADPTLFKRAISNIFSNALRYTPRGGKIQVSMTSAADFVSIVIQDTGIGIDEIHLTKLFDRFYRVDTSRSTATGGLGLGLAIVKTIIELHGGKISINSQRNIGTTVRLCLPGASQAI